MSRLFAYEEDGRCIVEFNQKKGFRKPKAWLEITEEDLPPRHQRAAWCIVDGALTVDTDKADKDEQAKAKAKRDKDCLTGEFIDALMSQANHDRLNGKELVQPLDDAVAKWLKL